MSIEPTPVPEKRRKNRTLEVLNAVFLALGLALFVVLVARLDLAKIMAGLEQVGWMFVPAFCCYVGCQFLSAWVWRACIDPQYTAVTYSDLLQITWAGHALNAVTPAGGTGELLKASLFRGKVPGGEVASSLILFNLVQAVTITGVSVLGAAACVLWLDAPLAATLPVLIATLVLALALAIVVIIVHRGAVRTSLAIVGRLPLVRIRNAQELADRAATLDERMTTFLTNRPRDLVRAVVLGIAVRVLQIGELWFLLLPLMPGKSVVLIAILMQVASQLIVWGASFIPARLGVLEGGNVALFKLAGLDPVVAFTTVIARRLRMVLGVSVGLLLGARFVWVRRKNQRREGHSTD